MTNIKQQSKQLHQMTMSLHVRALACHCECLGMNAENSTAVCADKTPPYGEKAYLHTMEKWGLISPDGKPNLKE